MIITPAVLQSVAGKVTETVTMKDTTDGMHDQWRNNKAEL